MALDDVVDEVVSSIQSAARAERQVRVLGEGSRTSHAYLRIANAWRKYWLTWSATQSVTHRRVDMWPCARTVVMTDSR